MKGHRSFNLFWANYGNYLLSGWLRAIQDGNQELFSDWVEAEYQHYLHSTEEYEVPYFGLLDISSSIERDISTQLEINNGV